MGIFGKYFFSTESDKKESPKDTTSSALSHGYGHI